MRIVVRDVDHALSFTAAADVVPALVAACSVEPMTVEALLLATESYYPGISDQVLGELMRFDLWMQGGATKVRLLRPEPGRDLVLPAAFEVVDPLTRQLAYTPDGDGLVVVDLETRDISTPDGDIVLPERRGSVTRRDSAGEYEVETIYSLSPAWSLEGAVATRSAGGNG